MESSGSGEILRGPMSEENVEVVSRMYEAFRRGDAEAAFGYIDPAVVTDASHRVDGRIGHGRDELTAILGEWLGTWDDWRQEVEEMRDLGDRVLVIETQRGRGKGSGIEWEGRFGMLYELESGKITRWTIYDDLTKAMEDTGLSE
jgi:ketosteroid isomerase-like protein